MATHVLDHDAPGLAGRLRTLNSESRRKVVVKASLFAAQRGLRPAKSHENQPELIYAAARSGQIEKAMDSLLAIFGFATNG
jgi:hypothetical protein